MGCEIDGPPGEVVEVGDEFEAFIETLDVTVHFRADAFEKWMLIMRFA